MNIGPTGLEFDLPLDAVLGVVTNAINRGRIFLARTAGTEFISNALCDLIERGKRGMAMGADTTYGKTQCLTYVLSTVGDDLRAEIWYAIVSEFKGETWESLLLDIAHALGLNATSRTSIDDRFNAIVLVLYEHALRSPYRTVILAIDEAQNLTPKQIKGLKKLANFIDKFQCTMFLWLAGQESIFEQVKRLEEKAPGEVEQLKERFMYNYRLPGISSEQHLRDFLELFDAAQFPQGYSVVGRFIPRAVAAGFGVAMLTESMWKVIRSAAPATMQSTVEIGIGHTVEIVSGYLRRASRQDQTNFDTGNAERLLLNALGDTGFKDHLATRNKKIASGKAS